mmetsp:Transcript_29916/g.48892  ORF Transcript_29916/g.48892 Transcript_29916/m.48892 type:complete len:527 (+) Transcript_29916:355-1935(+)
MSRGQLLVCLWAGLSVSVVGFLPTSGFSGFSKCSPQQCRPTVKSSLKMSYRENHKSGYGDEAGNLDYIKTLLTHQAVKTFMYYSEEFHDKTTTEWIKKFDDAQQILQQSAGKITWDVYMETLMRCEPEEISIKKIAQASRGGSSGAAKFKPSYFDDPIRSRSKPQPQDATAGYSETDYEVGTRNPIVERKVGKAAEDKPRSARSSFSSYFDSMATPAGNDAKDVDAEAKAPRSAPASYLDAMAPAASEAEPAPTKKDEGARTGGGGYFDSIDAVHPSHAKERDEDRETLRPNPYITNDAVYEYKVLIDPMSLAKRILTVREQLAGEWREDLKLIDLANQELLRYHYDETVLGEKEAEKGSMLVFESDPFGPSSPYRAESYKLLTEMVTTVAMRRFEMEVEKKNNPKAKQWLKTIKTEAEEKGLEGNDLIKYIFKSAKEGAETAEERAEATYTAERLARVIMSQRAAVAEENLGGLAETKADHSAILTRMLNEQLKKEMSIVDKLEYEYKISVAAESRNSTMSDEEL